MDLNEMAEELKMQQNKPIYTVEDFEERLAELTIGTEQVQQLMDFVNLRERQLKHQMALVNTAANWVGHSVLNDCLMEEQDG
jgi:hypothetical protein